MLLAVILRRKTRMKRRNRRTRENQIPSQRRKRSHRLVVRKSQSKRKVTWTQVLMKRMRMRMLKSPMNQRRNQPRRASKHQSRRSAQQRPSARRF